MYDKTGEKLTTGLLSHQQMPKDDTASKASDLI